MEGQLILEKSQEVSVTSDCYLLQDIALGVSVVGLVTLLIIFKIHKSRSKREMEELSSRFSELRAMENDFEGTQQK